MHNPQAAHSPGRCLRPAKLSLPSSWSTLATASSMRSAGRTRRFYDGRANAARDALMDALKRTPFPAQREVVQAVTRRLVDIDAPDAVINAEMGTGKTIMAIATAAVMHAEGFKRTLVLSPPHLVSSGVGNQETVAGARVWILNGPDTLANCWRFARRARRPQCRVLHPGPGAHAHGLSLARRSACVAWRSRRGRRAASGGIRVLSRLRPVACSRGR